MSGSADLAAIDLGAELEVVGIYLCARVDQCTCSGGGEWLHEAHCGYEPVARMDRVREALERHRGEDE